MLFACGALFVGGVLFATTKVVYRERKIEKEIEAMMQEANRIKNENKMLQDKIEYFQTPEFQEKMAKEKLNMQKTDENVAIIKPSPSFAEEEDLPQEPQQAEMELPNYIKWWNYFFKYN